MPDAAKWSSRKTGIGLSASLMMGILLLLVASGCGTSASYLPPSSIKRSDWPAVGEEIRGELGNTLVIQRNVSISEGYELLESIIVSRLGQSWILRPGIYRLSHEDRSWRYFEAVDGIVWKNLAGTQQEILGGFAISRSDSAKFVHWSVGPAPGISISAPSLKEFEIVLTHRHGYQRELIYNGMSGNTLRFLYREMRYGRTDGSLTQDIQYDLGEGDIIGFKGARIRVLEAKNIHLRYSVLSHFTFDPSL
jgi:hypothetical protein